MTRPATCSLHAATGLILPRGPASQGAIVLGFATMFALLGGMVAWSMHAPVSLTATAEANVDEDTHDLQALRAGVVISADPSLR